LIGRHVARTREMTYSYVIFTGKSEGKRYFGDTGVDV